MHSYLAVVSSSYMLRISLTLKCIFNIPAQIPDVINSKREIQAKTEVERKREIDRTEERQ